MCLRPQPQAQPDQYSQVASGSSTIFDIEHARWQLMYQLRLTYIEISTCHIQFLKEIDLNLLLLTMHLLILQLIGTFKKLLFFSYSNLQKSFILCFICLLRLKTSPVKF